YLSAELNRLCRIRVSTDISIRGLSPVDGLILPLYSVVAHRNATPRVQSIYFRTSGKDPLARFDEGVTRAQGCEAAGEGRARDGRAGEAFVREDRRASCLLQGGTLQRRVLVVGGHPCIAVFHCPIMRQTYATRKPLIF